MTLTPDSPPPRPAPPLTPPPASALQEAPELSQSDSTVVGSATSSKIHSSRLVNRNDVLHVPQSLFSRTARRLVPQNAIGKMICLSRKLHRVLLRICIIDLDIRRPFGAGRKLRPHPQPVIVERRLHRDPSLRRKHLEVPRHLRPIGTT